MTTHRNAVDYYVGRGPEAEYLGTEHNGHGLFGRLHHLMSFGVDEYTEADFRRIANAWRDTDKWPHAHPDSISTGWTVAYDKGSVFVYHHGVEMTVIRCNYRRWQPAHIAHPEEYPDGPSDQDEFVPRKAAKFPTFPPNTDTEG